MTEKIEKERVEDVVTMRQLLECGVHFGHQTKRWNPKMKRYIFTSRNEIHVIDLQQTIRLIKEAYLVVRDTVRKGGTVLFVGTKKQAQEAIVGEASRCGMPYVNQRWLGGTLTNNTTIRKRIASLRMYEKMKAENGFEGMTKKEISRYNKLISKLTFYFQGIKDMAGAPSLLFVVDTKNEQLAVNEANKLKIPIIGIVDTNADPTEVQYPVPANDDAIRAIKLLCSIVANAVLDGKAFSEAAKKEAAVAAEAPVEEPVIDLVDNVAVKEA